MGCGSRVVVSTSPSVSTQVSALALPLCIDSQGSAWPSRRWLTRVKPPGKTRQLPWPSDTANTRNTAGRGSRRPSCQTGSSDGRMRASRVWAAGLARMRACSASRPAALSWTGTAGAKAAVVSLAGKVGTTTKSSRWPRCRRQASSSPHHQAVVAGNSSSSPNKALATPGQKADRPGLSSQPAPGALATTTSPARIACNRPGTPRAESERNSSGSRYSSSTRRNST